jgi:hypothetical protein
VCAVAGLGGGLLHDSARASAPTAVATVLVDARAGQSDAYTITNDLYAVRMLPTFAITDGPGQWAGSVAERLDIPISEPLNGLSVSAVPGTLLLAVTARSDDAELATNMANAGADALADSLNTGPWDDKGAVHARTATRAVGPAPEATLVPGGGVLKGLTAGSGLGAGLALVLTLLDRSVRIGAVGRVLGLPLSAVVGRPLPWDRNQPDVGSLALSVLGLPTAGPGRLVLVSALANRRCEQASRDFATAASDLGHSTCLVDLDLRTGRLSKHLGLDEAPGLTELLVEHRPLASVLMTLGSRLAVLPAGGIARMSAPLTSSTAMKRLMQELAQRFDTVVLHAGDPSTDAALLDLAASADVVLLTVVHGRTTWTRTLAAAQTLRTTSAPLAGVMAVRTPMISSST